MKDAPAYTVIVLTCGHTHTFTHTKHALTVSGAPDIWFHI